MLKYRHFILMIFAVISLPGCINTVVVDNPKGKMLAPGEGVVVVSITTNTGEVKQFSEIHVTPVVREGVDPPAIPTEYRLWGVAPEMARDTSLFAGTLPVGEYYISELSYTNLGLRKFIKLKQDGEIPGTFTVRAGSVNDLGRLVATPIGIKMLVGRSSIAQKNADLIRKYSPDNALYFESEVRSAWSAPQGQSDVVEAYAVAHPVGSSPMVEAADGSVITGSRLGVVLQRGKDGHWRGFHTGGIQTIFCIAPDDSPDHLFVAGGEFDSLIEFNQDGKAFPVDTSDLPLGNVVFVTGHEKTGWFVGIQQKAQISIYGTPRLDHPAWREIRIEKNEFSLWYGAPQYWIWPTPTGFAYAFADGQINIFDAQLNAWTQNHLPNNDRIGTLSIGAHGEIGVHTPSGLLGVAYLTNDNGSTWREIPSATGAGAAAPLAASDGTLLVNGGLGKNLDISIDGGQTWTPVSRNFVLGDIISVTPSAGIFRATGDQAGFLSIMRSTDDGRTWETDLTTLDAKMLKMQLDHNDHSR